MKAQFAQLGYALVPGVLPPAECARLAGLVQPAGAASGGTRCLLAEPWCAALAARLRANPALATLIEPDAVAVQCTYFEKSAGRNWLVPLHQDLSIPVAARVDAPALRGWSLKEGTLFVQAPPALLEQLVAVRVHLDACGVDDGALLVVPGSHRAGVLAQPDAAAARDATPPLACLAGIGGALVMRPLLLHASSKALGQGRRRVLHFVFGPRSLPHGLAWNVAL
ncbi:phytanoyl-CoA dioxygenase family protein [Massilia violaceinigra]|uniref:Phytanoyl-CoA dioxygenase family protein n=1 Tax=Massilia violaceinigra TaxID=2045208 RepID=A0ABY4A3V9_9BURK|nr:phytanoyl-CoA dioxygenase family protein [Massilia violaceinigra]UOD29455.1 phytanoyl-CoA dioxygenase family protein [Massilia violaceinigra]